MLDKLTVKLFNTPLVYKNDIRVVLPFKKAEALFYYLLIEKQATRDELSTLFWGELPDVKAKKNLRNTIYKIKKALDMEVILSSQKSIIALNMDINIETDLDNFQQGNKDIQEYPGEFLQGFLFKDAEYFEEWVLSKRIYYKNIYTNNLYSKIKEDFNSNNLNDIERCANLLINMDELNEIAYGILMRLYENQGAHYKSIQVYEKLTKILNAELSVSPSAKTKKIYEEVLVSRNAKRINKGNANKNFFYGRDYELYVLKYNYENFLKNNTTKSILIIGEAGIGKTKIIEEFLNKVDKDEVYIMYSNCYQAQKEYFLKPWNNIFDKMSEIMAEQKLETHKLWGNVIPYLFSEFKTDDKTKNSSPSYVLDILKYQVAEEVILAMLNKISHNKKIVFIFDDLQWMDSISFSLLNSILINGDKNRILFMGTLRDEYEQNRDNYISMWIQNDFVEKLVLPRFNESEVQGFINKFLPNSTDISLKKIYNETEGNTFFLVEYLNYIKDKKAKGKTNQSLEFTSKMKDIMKSRFIDISMDGKEILNICSLFFDRISLKMLVDLSGRDQMDLINIIEELQCKNIIKETKDIAEIAFEFTHQKLREFIYSQQSIVRKQILHDKIGTLLEKSLRNDRNDVNLYSDLIYHYLNAGNLSLALRYMIKNIKFYLDFDHEFFPILSEHKKSEKYLYISLEDSIKQLKDIENIIHEIKKRNYVDDTVIKLEIDYFHVKGRYLIGQGRYEEGISFIHDMIDMSLSINSYNEALNGYKQIIYYYRQIHNIESMLQYTEEALTLAIEKNIKEQIGMFLRLKGLNKIMDGEYKESEELLKESINIFTNIEQSDNKYILNIAAAYNYLGEIKKNTKRFPEALEYYKQAMTFCTDRDISQGLYMFLTNAGHVAYMMGDKEMAWKYFSESLEIYKQMDVIWGRSVAEGYMALLLIDKEDYSKALEYIIMAEENAIKMKSPSELEILYMNMTDIKRKMTNNISLKKVFGKCLKYDVQYYTDKENEYRQNCRKLNA